MRREQVCKDLEISKLMCIFRGAQISEQDLYDAVQAVIDGGGKFIEITYNHPGGKEGMAAIRQLKKRFGNSIYVGAGTILNVQEALEAIEAGSDFIVAPSLNKEVIDLCHEQDLMCMPGACTSTEVVQAYEYGADFVKLFPAGVLGMDYANALMKPLGFIRYFAVCKMDEKMFEECLANGFSGAGVSSSINDPKLIAAKDFDKIREKTAAYVSIAKKYS